MTVGLHTILEKGKQSGSLGEVIFEWGTGAIHVKDLVMDLPASGNK